MLLSLMHSLSQQIFLGFLLGVLCNDFYKIEVHIRHISVFQDLVGGDTRPTYKNSLCHNKKQSHNGTVMLRFQMSRCQGPTGLCLDVH